MCQQILEIRINHNTIITWNEKCAGTQLLKFMNEFDVHY